MAASIVTAFEQANAMFASAGFMGLPSEQAGLTRQSLADNLLGQIRTLSAVPGAVNKDDTSRIASLVGASGFTQDQRAQLLTASFNASIRPPQTPNTFGLQSLLHPLNYFTAKDWVVTREQCSPSTPLL